MSENKIMLPQIDESRCTLCGICFTACPEQALSMRKSGPVFTSPEKCTFCTICEEVCPEHAIRCEFEIGWKK